MSENPFESTTLFKVDKCSQCGANMNANCHDHARYCSYSCKEKDDEHCNPHNATVGEGLVILLIFVVAYFGIKKIVSNVKANLKANKEAIEFEMFEEYKEEVFEYMDDDFFDKHIDYLSSDEVDEFIKANMQSPAFYVAQTIIKSIK